MNGMPIFDGEKKPLISPEMIEEIRREHDREAQNISGVFDGRVFRRVRKNQARIKELEEHQEAMLRAQQQASLTKVKDVEDWIRIVQTRTRALELLQKFKHNREVRAFLEEIECR
jgi:vacuolar-type H+-ATPase subunit E/Vma4